MKNKCLLLTALLLCFSYAFLLARNPSAGDTLRVLAIGNSFTVDACEQDLYGTFRAAGRPVIIGYVTRGGSSLEDHWNWASGDEPKFRYCKIGDGAQVSEGKATLARALADEPWEVVTFQQQSGKAAQRETIEPWLGKLVKYVRKRVPRGVRLMYYQTWAYDERSTSHWMMFGHLNAEMYPNLVANSREFSAKYKMGVIPVGTAVENLRTSFNMINVVRGGDHLNYTIGRYLAAATWYEALTGDDVQAYDYAPYTLPNPIRRAMARKCAHAAVVQPYEVTSMVSGRGAYASEEAGILNYDESLVPDYTLPDPLVCEDGTPVCDTTLWETRRRGELLELFRSEVYGRSIGRLPGQHYKVTSVDENVFGGLATRMNVAIYYTEKEDKYIDLMMFLPNGVDGPVPAFIMMNLQGNAGLNEDENVPYPNELQLSNYQIYGYPPRGWRRDRYPLEMILSRGYALLTFYAGDVDPDFDDGYQNGVTPFIYRPGQRIPEPDQWGAISEWAWAHSRVMDYLEEAQDRVDAHRVAVAGHSRVGKTALWTMAQDRRFALVISNCSGCSGAALSRRRFGQTVRQIQTTFPHWFCLNYLKYMDKEDELPVDQHELIALCAPRPVYVASATLDRGADPKGEFLSLVAAMPVYRLYGKEGLSQTEWPEPRTPVSGDGMGYHLRPGKHTISGYDWLQYLNFADKEMR